MKKIFQKKINEIYIKKIILLNIPKLFYHMIKFQKLMTILITYKNIIIVILSDIIILYKKII